MGNTAMSILTVIILTLTFEGLLFGEQIAERNFPNFEQPSTGGFWGALDAVVAVILGVWGALLFFIDLLTFNVPGAPWWVRLPVGSIMGGGLVWSITALIKGGGGNS